jgi:hypothetical protein
MTNSALRSSSRRASCPCTAVFERRAWTTGPSGVGRTATESPRDRPAEGWPQGGPPLAWRALARARAIRRSPCRAARCIRSGRVAATSSSWRSTPRTARRCGRRASDGGSTTTAAAGPRSTPTVDGDRLYAYGASGDIAALELKTGKPIWTVNVLQRFGGSNIVWGLSESPLVLADRILVAPAARRARSSRSEVGRRHDLAGRAAIAPATRPRPARGRRDPAGHLLHGQPGDRRQRDDGWVLWNYDRVSNRTANIATRHRPRQPRVPVVGLRHRCRAARS